MPLSKIHISSSDLFSKDGNSWLSKDRIKRYPSNFNIMPNNNVVVSINLNLTRAIGSYYGSLLVISNGTIIKKVPIDISIKQDTHIPLGFFAAFLGIMVSFLMYFRKFSAEKKKEAYGLFVHAKSAMDNARRQGRTDMEYSEGMQLLLDGIKYYICKNYQISVNFLSRSLERFLIAHDGNLVPIVVLDRALIGD